MATLDQITETLEEFVATLEPGCYAGADAARQTEVAAKCTRLAETATMAFAKRAVETGGWGHRTHAASAEQWLALVAGTSEASARETLVTADRLDALPTTSEKVRTGQLSVTQAAQVSAGAAVDPDAEDGLLRIARRDGMRGLRAAKERVIAAATDEQAAHELAVRERHLRTWVRGAATHGSFSGPTEEVAKLLTAIEPIEREVFDAARKDGRREYADAYRFDALIELAERTRAGTPTTTKAGSPAVARVRVDLNSLLDGQTQPGEICEIPGAGPVPVAHARKVLSHGLLELVITDGVDVRTVVSTTRHVPQALRIAIAERDVTCKANGCDTDHNLERHHVDDFARSHLTSYENCGNLKLAEHILAPRGVAEVPTSLEHATHLYLGARSGLEAEFGFTVSTELQEEILRGITAAH